MQTVEKYGKTWIRSELDFEKCRDITPNTKGHKTVAPYSEVCLCMGIAGLVVGIELIERRYPDYTSYTVQLYDPDGKPFSSPVLTGEGGLFQKTWDKNTMTGRFYYYEPKE